MTPPFETAVGLWFLQELFTCCHACNHITKSKINNVTHIIPKELCDWSGQYVCRMGTATAFCLIGNAQCSLKCQRQYFHVTQFVLIDLITQVEGNEKILLQYSRDIDLKNEEKNIAIIFVYV